MSVRRRRRRRDLSLLSIILAVENIGTVYVTNLANSRTKEQMLANKYLLLREKKRRGGKVHCDLRRSRNAARSLEN